MIRPASAHATDAADAADATHATNAPDAPDAPDATHATIATHAIDPISLAGAKAKGKRPYFFNDPDVERVLSITMAVAGELAVMRARLDSIEALLDARGHVSREDIEAFTPSAEQEAARSRWNQEYIARILRILQQEREAFAKPEDLSSEAAGNQMAED